MNSDEKSDNKNTRQQHPSQPKGDGNKGGSVSGEPQQCSVSFYENSSISIVMKSRRLEKGFSLQDIAKELHVRESYLSAIEENNLEMLPERAYTLGFLRSYATMLGLDGAWAVKKYKKELESQEGVEGEVVEDLVVSQSLISAQATKWVALTLFALVVGIVWWTSHQSAEPVSEPAPVFPQEIFRQEQGSTLPPASSPSSLDSSLTPASPPPSSSLSPPVVPASVSPRFSSPRPASLSSASPHASSSPSSSRVSSLPSALPKASASPSSSRFSSLPSALPQASSLDASLPPVSAQDSSLSPAASPSSSPVSAQDPLLPPAPPSLPPSPSLRVTPQ